jgi:hypothetical protein
MIAILAMLMVFLALAAPAFAVVHEQVAAYCSGEGHGAIDADGFLEPPGISDFTKKNFALAPEVKECLDRRAIGE